MKDALSIIVDFVKKIGITISFETIEMPTFLPGIRICNGGLIVDHQKLLYPGDILHEAGHLAVMPPRIRMTMNDDLGMDPIHQAGEMGAIAWSYAACIQLGLDPHVVFHEDGYKGGGANIVENFGERRFFGVPLLAWLDMTVEKSDDAEEPLFPVMKSWLCMVDKYV